MEIKKTITLNIRKQGKFFLVRDATTLKIICGTSAVDGNKHMYDITKKGKEFCVPIQIIKERIKIMSDKINDMQNRVDIMKQIVRGEKWENF